MIGKVILRLFSCLVCSFSLLCSSAFALQQADFSWLPNEEPNLAGYKIYYSTVSGQYDNSVDVGNPGITNGIVQATVNDLEGGTTYFFAATAYDSDGFESDYSREVVWTSPADEPPPSPPVAENMSFLILEDSYGSGQFNAQSSSGLTLVYQIVMNGSNGTAAITDSASGAFVYTPHQNYYGSDIFSYKVSDANGESAVASVTIDIAAVNDAPVADGQFVVTSEDQLVEGTLTAHDVDGDFITYTLGTDAGNGSVFISADGNYSYTPGPDFNGSDSFSFRVTDGTLDSNDATVTVSVNSVNDVPVAYDASVEVYENQLVTGVLQADDIDSSQLTYSIVANGVLGTATIVDPATGAYTYSPHGSTYGEDSFRFVVSDGSSESDLATVFVSIQSVTPSFAMEIGRATVDGTWSYISLTETFQDPVVVAKPASSNDPSPCVIRIRNVTPDGFEIRLQEYEYLEEMHGEESVSFIAMERGSFTLEDGTLLEAGSFSTNYTSVLGAVYFSQPFNTIPVVSTSVVSVNEEDAVVGRMDDITETGFKFKLREQEINVQEHDFEMIDYIAWEPSSGVLGDVAYGVGTTGDVVTHHWYTISFPVVFADNLVFVADMQTRDGGDTANIRYENLTADRVNIKVAEEASRDSEVWHTTENVGFMVFSVMDMAGDVDSDGLTSDDERFILGTNPAIADSDADGLDDGAEFDFWGDDWDADFDGDGLINILDFDADGDGYSDGVETASGFDPSDINSNPGEPGIESGITNVSSEWQRVLFGRRFVNPVVVAKIVSQNEGDPVVVRLENITSDGFNIRLQEWGYLDDVHGEEEVSYIVMEKGSYTLHDGTKVEAGIFSTRAMLKDDRLVFNQTFNVVPVVAASVSSVNEIDAVTDRIDSVDTDGFGFRLQEQELNVRIHAVEMVSYIAWEPSLGEISGVSYEVGITADSVTQNTVSIDFAGNYVTSPVIVTDMQTRDGGDTSVARCVNGGPDGADVFIEEEQSRDSEVNHITEVVGYMIIAVK